MRTFIYIDGFNFYYRAVRGTPYKWLDFKSLFKNLLSETNQIISIKYFTAKVTGRFDPDQPVRQKTYIRALQKHIPELSVHYGHFLSHRKSAPLAKPVGNQKFVEIIKTEEKGSDVNLAVQLLNDAWLNHYDCAVIVSNDSDLAESMRLVKLHHNKVLGLVMPGKGHPSKELMKHADFVKRIRKTTLSISQLPNPIPGTTISKPECW